MSSDQDTTPRVIPHPAPWQPPTAAHEPGPGGEEEPSIARVAITLARLAQRRWKLVAFAWLLVFLPSFAYALTAVPRYTASGAVQVSDSAGLLGANPLTEIVGAGGNADVHTEVEILKRREFILGVLKDLRLHVVDPDEPSFVTSRLDVSLGGASPVDDRLRAVRNAVEKLEIEPHVFEPLAVVVSAEDERRGTLAIGEDDPKVYPYTVGETLTTPELSLVFTKAPLPPGTSMHLQILPDGPLLERYGKDIHVRGLGSVRKPTNIVEVSVTSADRDTAQAIVKRMMERYIQTTLEWHSQSAAQVAEFIDGQLEEVRESLTNAEKRLEDYAESEKAVQLDTQAKVLIERAAEVEAQRLALDVQETTIGAVLQRMRASSPTKAGVTANFFEDPVLAAAVQALTEAEIRYETLRASLTPDHPQVRELGRAIEHQKAEVARLLRNAQKNVAKQRAHLDEELAKLHEQMSRYPDKQLELARLMRDMKVSEQLYTLLLEKRAEADIMKASTTIDKRIIDAPTLPYKKTAPKRARVLAGGAFGGLVFGVALVVGLHLLRRDLDTVEAIESAAGLPRYGVIPLMERPEGDGETKPLCPQDVWMDAHGALAEALRSLAVSLSLFPTVDDRGRVVAVTSSRQGEGKSTVTANLAVALAKAGKRLLVVDLDFRRPTQHRIWGVSRSPGCSDAIANTDDASHLQQLAHVVDPELAVSVVTAGTRVPDTTACVMSPRLRQMLQRLRTKYDFILLDSPPAFVADATAVANLADLLLLVARPGIASRSDLQHALMAIARVDVPRGLVVNAVGRQHTEDYYGSSYYYYASNYGDEGGSSGPGAERRKRAASDAG